MQGYENLRNGAAWLDVSSRGKIRLAGEDRARFLHAMTTNHIQQLKPGTGCYAFFLTAQGRILADANVFCRDDSFLLDTEPETRQKLLDHMAKFIIADDVTVEDLTPLLATIALEGPESSSILSALGVPQLGTDNAATVDWGTALLARSSITGGPGFFVIVPKADKLGVIQRFEAAGAGMVTKKRFTWCVWNLASRDMAKTSTSAILFRRPTSCTLFTLGRVAISVRK